MDILNHTVGGFLLGYYPTQSLTVGIASGLIASVPDIIPLITCDYKLYDKIHQFKHWMSWIPPITLHVFLDKFGHGEGKRWWVWKERMWLELGTWVINLCGIFPLVF